MERFKLKNAIYLIFASIFLFILLNISVIHAEDTESPYDIEITVTGLGYGDKHSDGTIVVTNQKIPGRFVFATPDDVINHVGINTISIDFISEDPLYDGTRYVVELDIKPIDVVIVFDSPIYKQYDGTNELTLPEYRYFGIIHDGVRVEGELTGVYAHTYVAENIDILLEGITLTGDYAPAYNLILTGHTGRIHPAQLQDLKNNVTLGLDENIIVDVRYRLNIATDNKEELVNEKFTSFDRYSFDVYDHTNNKLYVQGSYNVALKVDSSYMNKERLKIFELTNEGEFKEVTYQYDGSVLYLKMDADSTIVFATRNVEYHFIILFIAILLLAFVFTIIYRIASIRDVIKSDR